MPDSEMTKLKPESAGGAEVYAVGQPSRKSAVGWVLFAVGMLLLVIFGAKPLKSNHFQLISIAFVVIATLPFYFAFERRDGGLRRLVVLAVMTAIAVGGRALFAPVPAFNPVTAIVALVGIYMGPEAGFLVGSLSALISDIFFGQGPWTPFQMFSWGLIGAIAGLPLMSRLLKKRIPLLIYGVFAGFAYSLIMDIWTAISLDGFLDLKRYLIVVGTALPFTMTYVVANVIFLMLAFKPIGEKLERIRIKHGIF